MNNDSKTLAKGVLLRCKLAALSQDELAELAKDIQVQMSIHGPEAVRQAFSNRDPEELLKAVRQESHKQTLHGLAGGAVGGVAGGLGGALLGALSRGKQHALPGGILGILPGALTGYAIGKHRQQRRELADLLQNMPENR